MTYKPFSIPLMVLGVAGAIFVIATITDPVQGVNKLAYILISIFSLLIFILGVSLSGN